MRVLVCGSREWEDNELIRTVLTGMLRMHELAGVGESFTLIEGGAKGADRTARAWADDYGDYGVVVETFFADWHKEGKAAGPIRNKKMLEQGRPDLVVAFKDNFNHNLDRGGTEHMVKIAKEAGVKTVLVSHV